VPVEIDPTSPDWPKQQVADQLRAKIESGEMGPLLPSIMKLAELTGTSAMTVQRALAILKEEGLIYSVPGRGTFVR
jgi:DNA-binding GntR family transcriptional regulator